MTKDGILLPELGVWRPDLRIDAAGRFGLTATTPMLWIYTENDRYFAPALARSLYDAFTRNGGKAEFEQVGPYDDAVCRAIDAGAVRPSIDDAGVLSCRQMWLSPETAREQISALASVEGGEPLADSSTGLIGNLELHRPASLLLNDGRAIANSPASEHVIDPQPEEIAAPELAVDGEIEHREIAFSTLRLEPHPDCPDILRL
jgi:hypothetical protein